MVLSEEDMQELKEKCNPKYDKDCLDLIDTIEQLRADLRGKDNEIADLEVRIKYLQKFAPDKNEFWFIKG